MSELKTLKDINGEGYGSVKRCSHKELKAEAVKWVKDNPPWKNPSLSYETIEWIKHFFNLTEEDLKEVQNEK